MGRKSKAELEAIAFLESLRDKPAPMPEKPLKVARKRLERREEKARPPKPKKPKRTLAQKRAQTKVARDKRQANRGVTVILKAPHWINGIGYGPGVVHGVDPELAKGLLEDERRVEYNNQRFDGHMAAFIGPGQGPGQVYKAIPVPTQLFDSPMLNVLEAFTLT